jgi:hypothetical protein
VTNPTPNPAFPACYLHACPSCSQPLAAHRFADRRVTAEYLATEQYFDDLDEGEYDRLAEACPPAERHDRWVLRVLQCPGGTGVVIPLERAASVLGDDRIAGMVVSLNEIDAPNVYAALRVELQVYSASWAARTQDGK